MHFSDVAVTSDFHLDLECKSMPEPDEFWMRVALDAARQALAIDEVPIGACLVSEDGETSETAFNQTISLNDPTAHAEILAIRQYARQVRNYRLTGATIYTTIEPCAMCAGALVNARIRRVVFGAIDERFGAVRTLYEICDDPRLNHRLEITEGVLADECRELMQEFFKAKRQMSGT
jgi:tRNA(adenine34) deaminase